MANFVRSTELRIDTLNPTMRNFSCFPSRRSHLDSASYRTLVRIFSLCLDESQIPPQDPIKDPNTRSEIGEDPVSDRNGSEIPRLDGAVNGSSVLAEEVGHEKGQGHRDDVRTEALVGELGDRKGNEENDRLVDGGIEKGVAFANPNLESLRHEDFDSMEQSEIDECIDMELLQDLMSDCAILIDAKDDEHLNSELKEDMILQNPKLDDSEDRNLHSVDNLELGKGQKRQDEVPKSTVSGDEMCSSSAESKHGEEQNQEQSECINGESVKNVAFEKPTTVEAQDGSFDYMKETREKMQQETHTYSEVPKSTVSQDAMHSSSDELKLGEARNQEYSQFFIGESAKDMAFEKSTTVEEIREIREGMQQETHTYSDPLIDCSGPRKLNESLVDNEEIEEGEIPDQFENSDPPFELVHEHAVIEGQKLEEGSVYEGFAKNENPNHTLTAFSKINPVDEHIRTRENKFNEGTYNSVIYDSKQGIKHASGGEGCLKLQSKKSCSKVSKADVKCQDIAPDALGLHKENSEKLAVRSKEKPADAEAVEVRVKRKRGPLTEERKAKKKKAKKRKRAQKDREQGVKRLKLQPIVKPKAVKYCNFYLMGRCQQGDLCKFSHDTTPLTKSQPCKYFACDSCLKGDDCPFDHQLSKYPCHNYMSKGMCSRGDRCKFSHKLPITEGSSPTSVISKSDYILSPGKSNLRKQRNMNGTSLGASDPPKSTASRSQATVHKHLEGNLVNSLKEPKRVPNGIRFLSFGKGPSDSANKQKDNLPLDKHDGIKICNQQNQGKLLSDGHKNALISGQKSLPVAQCETNMMSAGLVCRPAISTLVSKESKNSSFGREPVGVPPRSLQNEVSEASKLLEEFLFCGGS